MTETNFVRRASVAFLFAFSGAFFGAVATLLKSDIERTAVLTFLVRLVIESDCRFHSELQIACRTLLLEPNANARQTLILAI